MPPSDEVDAAYGAAAERAPKGGGGLDLAQVSEQERKLAALVERQRDLERRDRDLTQAIAGAYIGSGDPAALEAEQREVRVQLNQITDVLPVLRARLDAGRVDAYAAVLVEWITNVATPASDKARERIAWHAARIAQLEHELAEVKEKAEQHRERAQLLTDSSRAFVRAFGLDVTPPSPPTTSPGEPLHRTETGRFLQGDQLAEACRAAVAALADDPDGDHALGTAVEALLVARPPKSMLSLAASIGLPLASRVWMRGSRSSSPKAPSPMTCWQSAPARRVSPCATPARRRWGGAAARWVRPPSGWASFPWSRMTETTKRSWPLRRNGRTTRSTGRCAERRG